MNTKHLPLDRVIGDLAREDRANLAVLLERDQDAGRALRGSRRAAPSIQELCEKVRCKYHSRLRNVVFTRTVDLVDKVAGGLGTILPSTTGPSTTNTSEVEGEAFPVPSWDELIEGLARQLKVHDPDADLNTQEEYICQAIIVRALQEMKPKQRVVFFRGLHDDERIDDWGTLTERGGPDGPNTKGPRAGLMGLGLAQAAGFSLYTSSASALAFLTGSVGLTLPFAAYTGLSSVIAVVTGPLGWLAAGGLLAWQMTSTDWKELTPSLVYIINARAREAHRPRSPRPT